MGDNYSSNCWCSLLGLNLPSSSPVTDRSPKLCSGIQPPFHLPRLLSLQAFLHSSAAMPKTACLRSRVTSASSVRTSKLPHGSQCLILLLYRFCLGTKAIYPLFLCPALISVLRKWEIGHANGKNES